MDSMPAKHRPRKVPVHLEETFHEEVARLGEIHVLEPVTEPTELVNSYVIVEKDVEIDSSNTYSPGHTIKKKLRLCIDPRDLNETWKERASAAELFFQGIHSRSEPICWILGETSTRCFLNIETSGFWSVWSGNGFPQRK